MHHHNRKLSSGIAVAAAAILAASPSSLKAQTRVYAMTNSTDSNVVLVYDRSADGMLTPMGSFATGGQGTGAGLGSQGALVLSEDNDRLLAVNAGSNEVSVFMVTQGGLSLVSKSSSGGMQPISLAVRQHRVFVLNAGGQGNITGFWIKPNGTLIPIPGSTRPLSSTMAGPAQISFSDDGETLIVTEKMTNLIDVYRIANGHVLGPVAHPSHGQTPFGFAFDNDGHLIVSEAFGGAPGASAVSSYAFTRNGSLRLISGSVPTQQAAACWVVVTGNGRFAYTTNTGSASVSGYRIGPGGQLSLLNPDGITATTGSTPTDMALDAKSRFLYVLSAGSGVVDVLRAGFDGTLEPVQQAGGIPASATGLAAH